ncbi:MAG: HupE/UreJ family protein [Betaproteobacteria bacterium]
MRSFRWLAGLLLGLCIALPAMAHKASDSYLTLTRPGAETGEIDVRWDIALRDLDNAITLDSNGDGEITWGEVRTLRAEIAAYALSRLDISAGGAPCNLAVRDQLIDRHSDGAYAVLLLSVHCAQTAPSLAVDYRLLFDVDPMHRGLLQYVAGGETRSIIFSADAHTQALGAVTAWQQLAAYVHEGIWHIWLGFDHILFLLSLLLPAVLLRRGGAWQPAESFRAAFWDVARIVTAFTVAHSITLTIAALDIVALPSRWVESAIALSVVLAAANNVFPVVNRGRWIAAFGFGLLHGFGFANALKNLGLPAGSLALSLFGFNVGVELGQLAIVIVFLPLAFASRATRAYRTIMLAGGSAAIAAIAGIWLIERALDLKLITG